MLVACGGAPQTDATTPGWAPVGGISKVQIGRETYHYADLLGDPRSLLEQGLPPAKAPGSNDGWVEYSKDLRIEYRNAIAVRMRARIPLGVHQCKDAARWLGFPRPRGPAEDGVRCTWVGTHLSNRLEKGYGGEFNMQTQWFVAYVVPSEGSDEEKREPGTIARVPIVEPE